MPISDSDLNQFNESVVNLIGAAENLQAEVQGQKAALDEKVATAAAHSDNSKASADKSQQHEFEAEKLKEQMQAMIDDAGLMETRWKMFTNKIGAGVNYDTIKVSGWHQVAGSLNNPNMNAPHPDTVLLHVWSSGEWTYQKAVSYHDASCAYMRCFSGETKNTPWLRMANGLEISELKEITTKLTAEMPAKPNLLINGDFSVWQRGREFPAGSFAVDFYAADRWQVSGELHHTEVGATVANTSIGRFDGIRIAVKNGATNAYLYQRIESSNTKSLQLGGKVTISGWIDFTAADGVKELLVELATYTSDSETGSKWYSSEPVKPEAAGWVYFERTIEIDTAFTGMMQIHFNHTAFVGSTVRYSAIKCELGSVATPFVADDPATNLMKCQRYFKKFAALGCNSFTSPTDATYVITGFQLGQPMRSPSPDVDFDSATIWVSGGKTKNILRGDPGLFLDLHSGTYGCSGRVGYNSKVSGSSYTGVVQGISNINNLSINDEL